MRLMVVVFGLLGLICTLHLRAEVSIDVSSLKPGEYKVVTWFNQVPVLVYKRLNKPKAVSSQINLDETAELTSSLTNMARMNGNKLASLLLFSQASFDKSISRSFRQDVLVVLRLSTRFGCAIHVMPDTDQFIDPCSNAIYDNNGRILEKNSRENYHLLIPPHKFEGDNLILIDDLTPQQQLIDFSPDIENANVSVGEKLMFAIEWRKWDLAKQYAIEESSKDYLNPHKSSALHVAAHKAPKEVLEVMLENGFDVNQINSSKYTPIHMAIM